MSAGFWNLVFAELACVGGPVAVIGATLFAVALRNKRREAETSPAFPFGSPAD